jgi:hypothetical protein
VIVVGVFCLVSLAFAFVADMRFEGVPSKVADAFIGCSAIYGLFFTRKLGRQYSWARYWLVAQLLLAVWLSKGWIHLGSKPSTLIIIAAGVLWVIGRIKMKWAGSIKGDFK